MKNIELNQYYNGNEIVISLVNYAVIIKPIIGIRELSYNLTIINNEMVEVSFDFESLESALSFVEDVVKVNTNSYTDIVDSYINKGYYKQLTLFKDWPHE